MDIVAANKQFATIEDEVDALVNYLLSLSSREALHTSGVLFEDFWLKAALPGKLCGPAFGRAFTTVLAASASRC
jgi:hypothetical protein